MKKTIVLLADGFEEVEALTVVDILRRAGVDVTMASVMGRKELEGSRGVHVLADTLLADCTAVLPDMIVLPGGMPGAQHLADSEEVKNLIRRMLTEKRYVAAICAAPALALGKNGFLEGKKATCYPGMESNLRGAEVMQDTVVIDGNIVTSRGPATAMPFALALTGILCGEKKRQEIAADLLYQG